MHNRVVNEQKILHSHALAVQRSLIVLRPSQVFHDIPFGIFSFCFSTAAAAAAAAAVGGAASFWKYAKCSFSFPV